GHRPAEGHERVASLAVEGLEELLDVAVDAVGLQGLVVEGAARGAVALDDERAVVDSALGAEPLGQAAAPGTLLTGGLVARPWSLPDSRAWLFSTHSSRCLESNPTS